MKRLLLLLIITLCSSVSVFAQDSNYEGTLIKPGKGIGEITIDLPYNKVVELLGNPLERRSQEQERQLLLKGKLIPEKELTFFLGFDYVLEYTYATNRSGNVYPVYKIYFKGDKVIYIILSSFTYKMEICKDIGIDAKIFFGNNKEALRKALGRSNLSTNIGEGTLLYDYLDRGTSFFLQKNEIRTIHIYAPMSKEQVRKYLRIYNS